MAVYRQVHVTFWQDDFVLNLTPEEKFFYLYLMTNSKTTQCGIYEIPKKVIEFETGYNGETVEKLLQRFTKYKKILYSEDTNEIMVMNWVKYNGSHSPRVKTLIYKELRSVKSLVFARMYVTLSEEYGYSLDRVYIQYLYSTDTRQQEEQEREREEEKEIPLSSADDSPTPYKQIVDLYNQYCTSLPKAKTITDKRKKTLRTRWKTYNDISTYEKVFQMAEESDFLSGRNGKWTGCNFDWLINENNMVKVLEGNYENKEQPKQALNKKMDFAKFPQHEYAESDLEGLFEDVGGVK